MLAAKSIGYSTGPSGVYLAELFRRLGIADQIQSKLKQTPTGVLVGGMIARGEVEIGFQQVSELAHFPGIEYVAPLPADIQHMTVFSSGMPAGAKSADAARAWITFLTSPAAATVFRSKGMEPGVDVAGGRGQEGLVHTTDAVPALTRLFSELVDGTHGQMDAFVLNTGDVGLLLQSLDKLSAADASRSVNGGGDHCGACAARALRAFADEPMGGSKAAIHSQMPPGTRHGRRPASTSPPGRRSETDYVTRRIGGCRS